MSYNSILNRAPEVWREEPDSIIDEKFKTIFESVSRQYENCELYHKLCETKDFIPQKNLKSIEDIKDIPYVFGSNFKMKQGRPKDLLTVPEEEIFFWAFSSGSSGDPSMVGRSKENCDAFFSSIRSTINDVLELQKFDWSFLFTPPLPKVNLDNPPIKGNLFFVGVDLFIQTPKNSRFYTLKPSSEEGATLASKFAFDFEGTLEFLRAKSKDNGKGGWISGSYPLMWIYLNKIYEETGETFNLGKNTYIVSSGGWKTYQGMEVPKPQFRKKISEILGIPEGNMRDIYAFTESDLLMGECEHHNKHLAPWADVVIRDVETMEPKKVGEKGLFNLINPLARSFAGVSLLQDDIAQVVMEDGCPCGRRGKIIEVFGRAEGAEKKGCGANIAEMAGM